MKDFFEKSKKNTARRRYKSDILYPDRERAPSGAVRLLNIFDANPDLPSHN